MTGVARAGMSRLGGFAAAALAGALASISAAGPAAATSASTAAVAGTAGNHVGIVISGVGAFCVQWHPGITGDDVLNAVARVNYRSDGVIVQINGTPASGTADDTHFWSYWHDSAGRWEYSRVGEGGYTPAAGEVEGWSFDDGAANPPPPARRPHGLYAAVCGGPDGATPTPSDAPVGSGEAPRAAAASAGGSPVPTLLAVGLVAVLLGGGGWAAARRRRVR